MHGASAANHRSLLRLVWRLQPAWSCASQTASFIMRKMKRQVRNFLRRISGHSHSGAQKIVQIMLLAARDGVN